MAQAHFQKRSGPKTSARNTEGGQSGPEDATLHSQSACTDRILDTVTNTWSYRDRTFFSTKQFCSNRETCFQWGFTIVKSGLDCAVEDQKLLDQVGPGADQCTTSSL